MAKEFLSRRGIPFEFHNLETDPLSKQDIVNLMSRPEGGMRDPIVDIGGRIILGCDKPFIDRVLTDNGDKPLPGSKVYGRVDSRRTEIALDYMREQGLTPEFHDLDASPLAADGILDLMYLPKLDGTRAPIIIHRPPASPDVTHIILGGDRDHIIEVFG